MGITTKMFPPLLNSTQNDWNMQKHCLVFKTVHCGVFLFELISGFFKGVQTSLHEFQKYLTSWTFTAKYFQLSKNFFQKSSFRSTAPMILWLFSARLHWNPVLSHVPQCFSTRKNGFLGIFWRPKTRIKKFFEKCAGSSLVHSVSKN